MTPPDVLYAVPNPMCGRCGLMLHGRWVEGSKWTAIHPSGLLACPNNEMVYEIEATQLQVVNAAKVPEFARKALSA
jgi:hypothetical protein